MDKTINQSIEYDSLKEIVEDLKRDVVKLFNDGNFVEYLNCISSFYEYSPRNILLILKQNPSATLVASYTAWNQKGYHIKRGEKAIKILCPVKYTDDEEEEHLWFKLGSVFDVSQVIPINTAPRTEEPSFDLEMAFESLMLDKEHPIEIADVCDEPNCLGLYRCVNGTIQLKRGPIPVMFRTLMHEKRHAISLDSDMYKYDNNLSEVIAESAAYVACKKFGVSSDDSFKYVGSYCKDKTFEELDQYLNDIVLTSRKLIRWVSNNTYLEIVS